jgi:hypothetical protein
MHARGIVHAPGRRDDELVGREHELGGRAVARRLGRRRDEPRAPLLLRHERLVGIERADRVPRFRRRDDDGVAARLEIHAEVAGAPQRARRLVAAALFDAKQHVLELLAVEREGRRLAVDLQAQARTIRPCADLVAVLGGRDGVRSAE